MQPPGNSGEAIFETERLTVRPWCADRDTEDAFAMYNDPEVMKYVGATPAVIETRELMHERLFRREEMGPQPDETGFWAAENKETGKVVGAFIFKNTPDAEGEPTGDFEIGWHFRQSAWGNGFASEGANALIPYAFRVRPDLDRIIAIAYPQNLASLRVMAKAGMSPVGMTDKYYGVPLMMFEVYRP